MSLTKEFEVALAKMEPGQFDCEVATDPQSYQKLLRELQAAGHKITMIQFDRGVYVITYVVAEKPRVQ